MNSIYLKRVCHGLLFLLILSLLPTAYANENNPLTRKSLAKQSMLNQLNKGEEIVINNERYVFLPDVHSRKQEPISNDKSRTSNSIPTSLLGMKGNFGIYQGSPSHLANQNKKSLKRNSETSDSYSVLLNQRTQQFAVVLGSLLVILQNLDDAEAIAEDFDLSLKNRYPHIHLAIYQPDKPESLFDIMQKLKKDPRVKSVEPELLEHIARPL